MSKILSIKIHQKKFSYEYLNFLTRLVKEILALFCNDADYGFCGKEINYSRKLEGTNYVIQWLCEDTLLKLNEEQVKTVKKLLNEVPYDAVEIDDDNIHDDLCQKHSILNSTWVSADKQNGCVSMDGYYMALFDDIEQDVVDSLGIKICNCVKRLDHHKVYYIRENLSIMDLFKVKKYVTIISSTILSYLTEMNLDVLNMTVANWNLCDDEAKQMIGDAKIISSKTFDQALTCRIYFTANNVPSLLIQDFNGSYAVLYKSENIITYENIVDEKYAINLGTYIGSDEDIDVILGWANGALLSFF